MIHCNESLMDFEKSGLIQRIKTKTGPSVVAEKPPYELLV